MKRIVVALFYAGVLFVLTSGMQNDDGRAGRTGSPGETTCANSCHDSFNLNSGSGSIVISASNMPGWEYVPGNTYNMSITIAQQGINLFGFGVEALDNSNLSTGQFVITEPAQTLIKNASVQGALRPNVVHALNSGSGNGSKTYNFDWVAPNAGVGPVTFYFAGTAANGNGNNAGDRVFSSSQVAQEMSVGVEEASENDFVIYPNPVTAKLYINRMSHTNEPILISLFDLNGRLVKTEQSSILKQYTLSGLDALSSGTYLIRLESEGKTVQQRIVIQ